MTDNRDAFTFEGGPIGALLLHGFTGTPGEMRPLAESLHSQGYTVHAPLLAGHGGLPELLHNVPWQAWQRSAERGYDLLAARCQRVVVVGQSLGGALATLVVQRRPAAGLVALATPLRLQDWRVSLVPLLRPVIPWFYPFGIANFDDPQVQEQIRTFAPEADLTDAETRSTLRKTVRFPLSAIDEVRQLLHHALKQAPFVAVPALIGQGRRDEITNPQDAELLYGLLGSTQKSLVWFEDSGHLLMEGPERDRVCETVGTFIATLS